MHMAAEQGDCDMVLRLIDEHGASEGDVTDRGWTAAHFAAAAGHFRVLLALRRLE